MLSKTWFVFLALAPCGLAASCESLGEFTAAGTTITLAKPVAAGALELPGAGTAQPAMLKQLPAFCRVAATLKPSADSDIKVEVWMPASGWNGKFLGVGNGGWSGGIVYPALANGLMRGYATASTNTGHDGGDARFALGHPEKLTDFGYRAVHQMTIAGKALVKAFYEKAPERSYWNGCSSGGKQGLKEAQKFPADYDGIVAGAPANYWTHLMVGDLWPAHAALVNKEAYLDRPKLELLAKTSMAACDKLDGLEDGSIENPLACKFDPTVLLCKDGASDGCLTKPQVEAARKIYAGAKNPRTGELIFPGMPPGSETVWSALGGGPEPLGIPVSHFRYVVFKNPDWDYKTLDFDKDLARADEIDGGLLNATDPNLKPFFDGGGKLLIYHGWNDQLISPMNSINYYESVAAKLGGAARIDAAFRLFMAPGMGHCAGGVGPSRQDPLSALEQWVEKGIAPDRIVVSRPDRSRPLCAYPKVAKYKGTGSVDAAENFVCTN